MRKCVFTKKCVSDWVVMLPHEEVVDWDIGKLRISSVWTQDSQPVLCGYDIVWVDGGLSQFQSVQKLLQLLGGQGVDVLTHHRSSPLVTVGAGPAKLTLTTVVTSKVTCNTKGKCHYTRNFMRMYFIYISEFTTHQYICRSDWKIWWATSLGRPRFSGCTVLPRVWCQHAQQSSFLFPTERRTHWRDLIPEQGSTA